jgi:hypothetical protein
MRDVACDGHTEECWSEMSLEQFVQNEHSDLDRDINERAETLNEKAGFHYNSLPKIHQTLIKAGFKHVQSNNRIHHYHRDPDEMHVIASWAGYKLRLPTGKVVTGRHHKHLDKHLAKYSDRS